VLPFRVFRRGELALVTRHGPGPSGCGKTCLVESVVRSALRRQRTSNTGSRPPPLQHRNDDDASLRATADGNDTCSNRDSDNSDITTGSKGLIISGKFDPLERKQKYSTIVQSLTEYALMVSWGSDPSMLRSVRLALALHRETVRDGAGPQAPNPAWFSSSRASGGRWLILPS
jgi:hypothetical protein